MAIHSICLVRDEADIIERTLREAARWSDAIYVYDNGSTDGTWETVLELARTCACVVPFRREPRAFDDGLRRIPFAHFRGRARAGDWWCRLDADEIYIDSPRTFLAEVPAEFDAVWSASFQYYLSDDDAARHAQDPSRYADDVPIEQKCRYYLNNWSEMRFFRHSARLRWDVGGWPYPLHRSYSRRIRLKHYQYRSPQQIERRLDTRRAAIARGRFKHEARTNWAATVQDSRRRGPADREMETTWHSRVLPAATLVRDDGETYLVAEELMPPIVPVPDSARRRLRRALPRAWARWFPRN